MEKDQEFLVDKLEECKKTLSQESLFLFEIYNGDLTAKWQCEVRRASDIDSSIASTFVANSRVPLGHIRDQLLPGSCDIPVIVCELLPARVDEIFLDPIESGLPVAADSL